MASMVSSLVSYIRMFRPHHERRVVAGSSADIPLEMIAVPGLITLLDVALYNAVEGELATTLSSGHNLLAAWLDLKRQSIMVLQQCLSSYEQAGTEPISRLILLESFARACYEASCDALENISTDVFATSANLSDPYKSVVVVSSELLSTTSQSSSVNPTPHYQHGGTHYPNDDALATAIQNSAFDTGRRIPLQQRGKDCWESPRLFCPDYVNLDESAVFCQRLLKKLLNHGFVSTCVSQTGISHLFDAAGYGSSGVGGIPPVAHPPSTVSADKFVLSNSMAEYEVSVLLQVLSNDIPARLIQFRASIDADCEVTKRLYMIKSEYRAPFRAFLEAHQSLQRTPSLDIVEECLRMASSSNTKPLEQRKTTAKNRLQKLLESPVLIEALALEQRIEEFEVGMAKQLLPFCELARYLENKRARLRPLPALLRENDLPTLQRTLHCLKNILCRSSHSKSHTNQSLNNNARASSGIRPLLLDLQGIPRDDETDESVGITCAMDNPEIDSLLVKSRLDVLVANLELLGKLCQTRYAFRIEKKNNSVGDSLDNVPAVIARGCTEDFDSEVFRCQVHDWMSMVYRQQNVTTTPKADLESLEESVRRAEMQVSLANANAQSLEVVMKRLQQIVSDHEKRFEILKETVETICLREMNIHANLSAPDPKQILVLKPTSAVGIFGIPLQMAGEKLPIG